MSISNGIPKDFYKLFNSKYMEYYQKSLVMLYRGIQSGVLPVGTDRGRVSGNHQ